MRQPNLSGVKADGGYRIANRTSNITIESTTEMKPMLVQIWKSRDELEKSVANKISETIRSVLQQRSQCRIALSGGETPKNVYHILGESESKKFLDWNKIHVFFCDERMVPPEHSSSNFKMIQEEWLSHSSIPPINIHRILGEIEPASAAQKYEQEIRKVFGARPAVFDFILLGIGEDGHTASLFPDTDALTENIQPVKSVFVQKLNSWRVTLTLPVLNAAHEIIFLVAGKQKSSIVKRVLESKVPDKSLPATLVRPFGGTIFWMINQEAGMLLTEHSSVQIEQMTNS